MDRIANTLVFLYIYIAYRGLYTTATQISSQPFSQTLQGIAVTNNHVYLGAISNIYKLNSSTLSETQTRILDKDSTTLIGVYDINKILVCTSRQGQCEFLSVSDLSTTVSSPIPFVTPENDGHVVFVKAGFRRDGQLHDSIFLTSSFSKNRIATTARKPENFDYADKILGTIADPTEYSSELKYVDLEPTDPEIVSEVSSLRYLYAFAGHDYTFYVKNVLGKAYIGGSCNNDIAYDTLVELPLTCNGGGMEKKYLQAVTSGKAEEKLLVTLRKTDSTIDADTILLYGVFGTSVSSSATSLCIFNVKRLIEMMDRVFDSCHLSGADLSHISIGPKVMTSKSQFSATCSPLVSMSS